MWPLSRKPKSARKPRGRANPIRWRRVLRATAVAWTLIAAAAGALSLVYDGHLVRAGEALAAAAGGVAHEAGLVVREVYVTGRGRTSETEIVRALGLRQEDPILAFDPAAARERLLALPWIKAATVVRKLPATIEVELTERQPLALWGVGKTKTLIDREGVPIGIRDLTPWQYLPLVRGDDAPENAATLIDALRVDPGLYRQVKQARRVGGRRWDVLLAGGIAVHLPEDELKAAWQQLATLANDKGLFDRDIVAVDLRLPDRLVVRLSPEAAQRRRDPGKQT